MSDICSAETRGQAGSGISGCGVGGVGTRLAGYSRGGGAGSRRWMALTESRLLKQHDISWNESTHAHTHTHTHKHPLFFGKACALPCTQTGTPSFSSFCHVPLYSPVFHLTLQVSSKPSHVQRTLVAQCVFSFFLTHVFI